MSYLTRLSLQLGAVVMIAVVILFAGGVWAATQLKQDLLPDISFPGYIVIIPYPGAGPSVVDSQVTVPVGNALQTVTGVTHVNSTSSQGASIIQVEFSDSTNPDKAQQDVTAAVDKVRPTLPASTRAPTIQAFSTNSIPILQYSVYADEPLDQLAGQLRTVAVPKLKGLSGVSTVNVSGAATQEVEVTLDVARLAQHGLTVSEVAQSLQGASLVQSVGTVKDNGLTVPVQVASSLTSVDQISHVVVSRQSAAGGGAAPGAAGPVAPPVTVGELGTVKLAAAPSDTITRTNGKLSIGIGILKTPSGNTVQVADQVKAALPDIQRSIGHNVRFEAMQDSATPVTDAIGSILREGLLGALFAIVVIFAFLRSLRATVVAAISIPLSLLVALLFLWWQNITLNILTLGGMTVAIGRVVDDAIVVLENISRHVQGGRSPRGAAMSGAREIVTAVTSSTLTTVAVFLPIAFLSGIAGQFFRPFALTVVTALLASLVVAVTVVPLFASRLLKTPRKPGVDRVAEALQRVYVPVIRWATGHRLITVVVALVLLFGSLALVPRLRVNLLDQSSTPSFSVNLQMPENSTLDQTNAETQRVEGMVRSVADVKAYEATVGGSGDPFAPPGTVPADPTIATVLVLVDKQNHAQVQDQLQQAINGYSGPAKITVGAAQSSSSATSSGVQLQVKAPNPAALQKANDNVLSALGKVQGLSDVKSNLAASKPQYVLAPTPALSQSGLSLQALAALVAQAVGGQVATQATLPQGQLDVRVQLPPGTADTPASLQALQVPSATGMVPLSTLASLQKTQGPQSLIRVDGNQTATITATMTGNDTRVVQQRVNNALAGVSLPGGASVSTGGVFDQLNTVLTQFILAILGAIALVYLIMVATFRSLLKPLVLLVSIPFAAIGAIVALVATNTSLSLPGLIGLLMLIGIVVTNAIVLLDLVEQYRDRGMSVQEALIEGGRHRLRPILMTALATMLALVPMAFGGDSGGGFIGAPLAMVVIGGLFTSTLLTLILVPVLYSLTARFTRSRRAEALEDEDAPLVGSLATRPQHPLVTIFAAAGLPARPIAEKVAERLRVPVLDLGGSVEQLTATLEKALSSEDRSRNALSDLLSRLGAASDSDGKSAFRTQLREAVLRLGSRTGGVVVSPVAAVVLSDQPGGLHVRLVAPLERRLAGARQEGESEDDARRRLEEIDREREASVKDTYGLDLNDPRLYQLTLDPTVFPLESCVDLIATAAESAVHDAVGRPAPAVTAPSPAG